MKRTKGVLLLGDERLYQKSILVTKSDLKDVEFLEKIKLLQETLENFRNENGFGRAIAFPQIGYHKRVIACHIKNEKFLMINPEITWKSEKMKTLYDDCFSFPDLYVKVKRYESITVKYYKNDMDHLELFENIEFELSELFQHENDHLDGILSFDRMENEKYSIVYKDIFEKNREFYEKMVDYTIPPMK